MREEDTAAKSVPLGLAHPLHVARLSRRKPTPFDIRPEGAALQEVAALIGVTALRKLRFEGALTAEEDGAWSLSGHLGATVVQPCCVTLAAVTTRIDDRVLRRYLPHLPEPQGAEVELPDDVDIEPLDDVIDPAAVMIEALVLAVPDFPRAPDAELGEAVFAAPGTQPLRDEDVKPLAQLAALRDRLRRN